MLRRLRRSKKSSGNTKNKESRRKENAEESGLRKSCKGSESMRSFWLSKEHERKSIRSRATFHLKKPREFMQPNWLKNSLKESTERSKRLRDWQARANLIDQVTLRRQERRPKGGRTSLKSLDRVQQNKKLRT